MDPIKPIPGRTLQAQVAETIIAQIQSGKLVSGDPLLPERQLGEELGVSRITVIRALEKLAADGWITRHQGRGTFVAEPPTPRGPTLAFLAAVPAHPALFRSLIGMSEVVNAAYGQLRLLGRFEGLGSERDMAERALRDGADGLIIYPDIGLEAPQLYHDLVAQNVPLVLIDRFFPDLPTDHVTYDDRGTGAKICARLLEQGARRIAVLSHREFDVTSVQARIQGARDAAAAHNLADDSICIWPEIYCDFSPSRPNADLRGAHLERLRARLTQMPVDAIFAINGDVGERVARDLEILMAQDANLQAILLGACGHQAIIGPNGTSMTLALEPAEQLGRTAAEILLGRLRAPNDCTLRQCALPMSLQSP